MMALNVKNGRRGLIPLDKLVFAGDLIRRSSSRQPGDDFASSSSRSHKKRDSERKRAKKAAKEAAKKAGPAS